jgi:cobyrinic acid a,c-diamide synthase
MFAREIAGNREFIEGVRAARLRGLPIYAECGGMMFLSRGVTDFSGCRHTMAGIIPGETVMLGKRAALGYVSAEALGDSILAPAGRVIRGHEFHYSELRGADPGSHAYLLKKAGEEKSRPDGYVSGSLLASYLHIHFAGCPREAENFVNACRNYRIQKGSQGY